MTDPRTEEELVQVTTVLGKGELVAVPQGTMFAIHRVVRDDRSGETEFEFEGLATMTGACNTLRWWKA